MYEIIPKYLIKHLNLKACAIVMVSALFTERSFINVLVLIAVNIAAFQFRDIERRSSCTSLTSLVFLFATSIQRVVGHLVVQAAVNRLVAQFRQLLSHTNGRAELAASLSHIAYITGAYVASLARLFLLPRYKYPVQGCFAF